MGRDPTGDLRGALTSESHREMGQRALGPLSNRSVRCPRGLVPGTQGGSVRTALLVQADWCRVHNITHLSQRDPHSQASTLLRGGRVERMGSI